MPARKKILAISGSTKKTSGNKNLIRTIGTLFSDEIEITIFEGLTEIPHFNPDLDTENPPATISGFRNQLRAAEGVLICTPEYAMGVPGTLKNAIDWTVSSCEFSHKPVALITASSIGEKGHRSLMETLKIIECNIPDESQLLISYIKTKMNAEGQITDAATLEQVQHTIASLIRTINT